MIKKIEKIIYCFDVLSALDKMRRLGQHNFEKFVHTLGYEKENNDSSLVKLEAKTLKRLVKYAANIISCGSVFASKIPVYYRQASCIQRNNDERVLALALSSKRISIESDQSIREQLVGLCRPLGGDMLPESIRSQLISGNKLFICDPSLFSKYWSCKQQINKEKVFIIDGGFLLFIQLYSLFFSRSKTVFNITNMRKQYKNLVRRKPRYHSFLSFAKLNIFIDSFGKVFNSFKNISGIFTTSNNTLTELLRAHLMLDERCEHLLEILHGIPCNFVHQYFREILSGFEMNHDCSKQRFIPLIPSPSLPLIFDRQLFSNESLSINVYFNQYLNSLKLGNSFLGAEIKNLIDSTQHVSEFRKPLVITFLGGNGFSDVFIESAVFQLEQEIIKAIIDKLKQHGIHFVILYSPHPVNKNVLKQCKFFSEKGVFLTDHTIPTWFISHGVISLYSAALFEAAFLGIKPLSFMRKEDNLYSEDQLAFVNSNTSENTTDINVRINEFIGELSATEFCSMDVQIKERAKILGIDMDEFVISSNLEKSKGEIFCT